MIISFQLWKIVLGLIISAFLIMFAVNYIGGYMQQQSDMLTAKVMNNFEIGCYEVYNSGNSLDFNDFSKISVEDVSFSIKGKPGIVVPRLGRKSMKVPVFFSLGGKVFIWRGEDDMGWWMFRYVIAMPETEILFSMNQNSENAWKTLRDLVKALPESTNFENKITYGFCYGNKILRNFCGRKGKEPCEAKAFLEVIESGDVDVHYSRCTADLKKNQRLVSIAASCPSGFDGVCIESGDGSGKAYLSGTETVFHYKDPLDLAVLVVGYNREDAYGVAGEKFFVYKNLEMSKELLLAAKIVSRRAELLSGELNRLIESGYMDVDSEEAACVELFQELASIVQDMESVLKGAMQDIQSSQEISQLVEKAAEIKKDIVEKGCDYA